MERSSTSFHDLPFLCFKMGQTKNLGCAPITQKNIARNFMMARHWIPLLPPMTGNRRTYWESWPGDGLWHCFTHILATENERHILYNVQWCLMGKAFESCTSRWGLHWLVRLRFVTSLGNHEQQSTADSGGLPYHLFHEGVARHYKTGSVTCWSHLHSGEGSAEISGYNLCL